MVLVLTLLLPGPSLAKGRNSQYRGFTHPSIFRHRGWGKRSPFHAGARSLNSAKLAAKTLKGPRVTHSDPIKVLPRGRRGRLVVGVMGSAAPERTIPADVKGRLEQLGGYLGRQGHVVLTGACPGMPQLTARAAKKAGGFTAGISPAGSLKEHTGRFHSPTESLDVIQMTGSGAGMGLIAREKLNIKSSDILVFAGGRSGTLGEILFAMQEHKVIALLDDSTGVTSKFKKQILPIIGRGAGTFVSDRDPVRLMQKAEKAYRRLKRNERPGGTLHRLGSALGRGPRRGATYNTTTDSVVTDATTRQHNVFTFFGTTRKMSSEDRAKVMTLVDRISADRTGGRKPLLVTPVRRGLTSTVARAAKQRGVTTVGISHASTPGEVVGRGKPRKMFDRIQLTGEGKGVGQVAAYRHAISKSDVVFVAGGDHKTLGGTVFAMYQPTVVAVLETKGMTGKLRSHILSTFNKPAHATMIYDSDPVRLYNRAVKAAEQLRHTEKTEYIAPE